MSDPLPRRPARQRAVTEQDLVTSAPAGKAATSLPEMTAGTHDPGGWLAIGLMVLTIVAVTAITILAWQAA